MWLIITLIATFIASIVYFSFKEYRKKFKLGSLALMLLGTFIMVLVDRMIAFFQGEPFIEITTEGLVSSGTMLGFLMIIPIFAIWIISVSLSIKSKQTS